MGTAGETPVGWETEGPLARESREKGLHILTGSNYVFSFCEQLKIFKDQIWKIQEGESVSIKHHCFLVFFFLQNFI